MAVVQTVFSWEFQHIWGTHAETLSPSATLEYVLSEFGGKMGDTSFAGGLLQSIMDHRDDIRIQIETHAPAWPFDKIAPVDRAILEMGVAEIMYSPDVPPVVAIDEAIEVAKVFGGERSSKFINGVLSAVMHAKQPSNEPLQKA